ncbi:hypothetical protein [Bacillus chungangensis]|uniref:DUF8052 domain-containing protein n=1 Tax=Bacillus chungangensis TaxID=587633 RepID=A0ABT9WQ29_9BACI|nr:hypothetical protein [Bacillus chungangensis]MDQ0175391.1 hypothetical protein [Bacillus chungangensis]
MCSDIHEQNFVFDLMNKYVPYFDVDKHVLLGEMPLAFVATHKRRDEKYMMTRKIKVWEVENQQVIFAACSEEEVTKCLVQQFLQIVEKHFKSYIPSYSEHMSTIFIAMILTNQPVHENAIKEVKKYRKIKFMKFGCHGWAEIYATIVDYQRQQVMIHPKGKQFVQPVKKILQEGRR